MAFQWDEAKATSNLRKHGIDFADAVGVFHDPLALSRPDDAVDDERFDAVGADFLGRILVVVYTLRGNDVRIISARAATRAERLSYEAGLP